jgi:Skp family chaperone for outer membrane proteins
MANEKELEVVRSEAANVVQWANQLVVSTVEDYKGVVARLQDIKAIRSKWVAYWAPLKEKAHGAWKEIVQKEKEGTDVCDNAERTAKNKALAWKQEADRKAAEEQRKLQAVADEKARKERERLEKAAEKLKTPELKEARLEEAATVEAPVITVAPPTLDIAGQSSRKTWKGEVVDMAALIAAAGPGTVAASFLQVNEKTLRAFAISTKGKVAVAGVKFTEVESLSIGRG